ncbi:MAG: hypothetical protein F6J95_003540 [Leptolyngbya sp. SIO1E4]|nr:hypothetical protein [Leptolyngbya sp. SIO1E4]
MSDSLKVLIKPCSGGSCPALYQDDQGRVFVQGTKLVTSARTSIEIAGHEDVVEVSPDLLDYLRSAEI